jgi:hypothetical protein
MNRNRRHDCCARECPRSVFSEHKRLERQRTDCDVAKGAHPVVGR